MQALKQKMKGIYEYSKGIFIKDKTSKAVKLIQQLLERQSCPQDQEVFRIIAQFSLQYQEYPDLCDFLFQALDVLKYEFKSIKRTLRLLDISLFLLTHGNGQFATDFERNIDLFQKISAIDTHHFEGKHVKDTKNIEYSLQLIRQRALYLVRLLADAQALNKERELAERQTTCNDFPSAYDGNTGCNLKISSENNKMITKENSSFYEKSANCLTPFQNENISPTLTNKYSQEPIK